jgi:Fe-S-cluster-containing dehydrogenase component
MQACPSGAIVFGNLNDKNSRVSGLFNDPRCYHLLEELHTLPNTGYLTKVRNDEQI